MMTCHSNYQKVTFVVNRVVGKGRPRFTTINGHARSYTPAKTKGYEREIKTAYLKQSNYCSQRALSLSLIIYIKPNRSTRKREKTAQLENILLPKKKPDVDNVAKAFLDALNGVAYDDDTQVNILYVERHFSTEERVEVIVEEIGEIELKEEK